MMLQEIGKEIMRKFRRTDADDVVVSVEEERKTQIKFSNNKISATQTWQSMNINLFVAIDKRLITTSLHEFSPETLNDTSRQLMKFAKSASPNKEYGGIAKGPFAYPVIDDTYDKSITELGEKHVDLVETGINAALSNGATRAAGVLETGHSNVYLITSSDVEAEDRGTTAYFSIRAFKDNQASGHYVSNARMLKDCKIESAAMSAAQIAKKSVRPKTIKNGKYDIIFESLPAANLLEQIGNAASIFNVESGLSCLAGKLNKQIGSRAVTLLDNPTLPGGVGSVRFDAEGVPTQQNTIIENGVLKTYLHNTSTAKRHNTVTTANAGLVAPEPFNIILKKGNFIKDEMFSEVKRGLWVTNVWYTRFNNYESGDFSTIPRDGVFLIEKGRIISPVKDIRISDNLLNMLGNVAAIGANADQVMGWEVETPVCTAPILVKDVRVTKSAE